MISLPHSLKPKIPFLLAGFLSFLFSVWLYFGQDEQLAGIFVGLWVPSIHSLGTLIVTSVDRPEHDQRTVRDEVRAS